MTAKEVVITPSMASILLANNPKNRPLKRRHIVFLCEEIRNGRWKFNGDAIRIGTDGSLIDGQHRLEAVRQTDIAIKALVVDGLDPNVFDTIDGGALRTAGDTLTVAGEKNGRNLAGALVVADEILSGKTDFYRQVKVSNAEILNMLNRHPDIRRSMIYGNTLKRLAPASVTVALHYIFSRKAPEKADRFFQAVATGENLDMHNPAYVLRQRLIDNATSKAKLTRRYIAALFVKAWNVWLSGGKTKNLRFREFGDYPEQFPEVRAK
jgi:hypothetical protein